MSLPCKLNFVWNAKLLVQKENQRLELRYQVTTQQRRKTKDCTEMNLAQATMICNMQHAALPVDWALADVYTTLVK